MIPPAPGLRDIFFRAVSRKISRMPRFSKTNLIILFTRGLPDYFMKNAVPGINCVSRICYVVFFLDISFEIDYSPSVYPFDNQGDGV